MARLFLTPLFFLSLTQSVFAGTQTVLYVSPDGSGTSFAQAQPGNLFAARDYIRTNDANMSGDIVVYLYGGTYQLTNSFQLQENATNHDSGTGGFNILYQAYPGQFPIMSGGLVVTNWSLFDTASNIWRAYVGLGINSRQLYVNGVRAIRARGPLNPSGFTITSTGFTTTNNAMQFWGNQTNIEIVQRNDWKQLRCPIASISGNSIVMQTPGWTYTSASPTPGPPWNGNGTVSLNAVSWVENAYELLASPGMWYLNQATGYLYYIPRPGENLTNAEVVLPVVEKLIDASGNAPATPIHNIVFSGITFAYGTWLLPSTSAGYADNQAAILWSGPTNALKTLGNVSFQTASNIQLTNDTFEHLGGVAIDFGGGAHNNTIIGNHIEDISSGGITLGEVTDFAATNADQMTDGNVIEDNYIRRVGQDYEDAVAIWAGYARNTLIAHNDVDNVPYSGMSVGWGWGTTSYAANNQIVGNYVGKVMQTLSDGGSVYTLSEQGNSFEGFNYYKDSCYQGIYWDEGTSYYTGVSNVIDNCTYDWLHIHSSGGISPLNDQFDTATNNFSNVSSLGNNGNTDCVITNNVYVSNENWPPAAQAIIQNAGLEVAFQSIASSRCLIDDADTNCVYSGNWSYSTSRPFGDYDDDVHSTTNTGDSITCTFYGTRISAVCEMNSDEGNVDVYLDGVFQATVDCNSPSRLPQQTIFNAVNLSAQTHILRLVDDDGSNLVVDAFLVQDVPEILVNDTEATFDHVPSDWTYSSSRGLGDYHGDVHYSQSAGQYLQYTFNGTGVSWIGEMNNDESNVDVYLDGTYQTTVNCYTTTRETQQRLFTAANLSTGSHTLKLVNGDASYMVLDAFAIVPVNFMLSATPASVNLNAGGVAYWTVNVSTPAGSTNSVTLSVTGLPPFANALFSPASLEGSGVSTLQVSTSAGTPSGIYPLTISAVSGTSTYSATVELTVAALSSDLTPYEHAVLNDNPVGYWPLDLSVDTNGVAADLSGNTNNGVYVHISSPGNKVPGPSSNILNGVSFDGATTYVDLSEGGNTALLNIAGPITMEAWVQPAVSQSNQFGDIIAKGYDAGQNDDELEMRVSGGGFHGGTYNGTVGDEGASYSPATTNWAYLVCTWDGTNWNLYVNGQLVGTSPDAVGAFPFGDPWAIGDGTASGNTRFFTGSICQVALYSEALTPAQVSTHYFAAAYGPPARPQIYADVQNPFFALQGGTTSNSVGAYGSLPIAYQWQFKGRNLSDGYGISGSLSNVLTLANAQTNEGGTYQCIVSNSTGSVTSSPALLIFGNAPMRFTSFTSSGGGWTVNQPAGSGPYGSTPIFTNGVLTLTDGNGNEQRSFFLDFPQYIGAFKASWTYQVLTNGADGAAFCLQNDPRGQAAVGGGGGGLGVSGITPSVELEFNLYTGAGETVGYAFQTNGLTGANGANGNYMTPGSINIASGDPISVSLDYNGKRLSLTLTDAVTSVSFSTNLLVDNLVQIVGGSTAYVGFTGADGGIASDQIISNFSFVSIPTATLHATGTNTVMLSWPGGIYGYALQMNSNLTTANWINMTDPVNVVSGQNQAVLPMLTSDAFYRLVLP